MIKGTIQKEDITIVSTCAPNIGAPKHIKKILIDIKGEIDSNTKLVGYFNTPLISMDRLSRQEKSSRIHSLFNCTHNIIQDRSHASHKKSLSKFKKIEIIFIFYFLTSLLEYNCFTMVC